MNCLKTSSENDINEFLLNNIELKPLSSEVRIDDKLKIVTEKPWQFFLDTHTNRSDLGWWKKTN